MDSDDGLPPWTEDVFASFNDSPGNGNGRSRSQPAVADPRIWPEPKPLPPGLAPVDSFQTKFLPNALAPWVEDISNRLQCPPDYVGVSATTALGAIIGRRVGIKPQVKTDWLEVPNLWGAFVGRPGMMKSPAMQEALKPIHRVEADAAKENEIAQQAYNSSLDAFKLRKQVHLSLEKSKLKSEATQFTGKKKIEVDLDLGDEPQEPKRIRYVTNDSSYEALGELLIDNPNGVLVERDELVSLWKQLDREDQAAARGFYLSGWSGTQQYTFDRIVRGYRHIPAACISVLGNTQPARICEYIRRAHAGGAGGDGLIQRFGLLAWPDVITEWTDVDEYPDSRAREIAFRVYECASKLDISTLSSLGAVKGVFDAVPSFHFSEAAHSEFLAWRTDLERRLRSAEISPALEGHLSKYRKLVPALALINHIADQDHSGAISRDSLTRALAFSKYLESHAKRIYGSAFDGEISAAKAILLHIRRGDLQDGFTAREVHRRGWAHLTEHDQVEAGLRLLVDLDHVVVRVFAPGLQGGRPKIAYSINPRTLR